MDKELTYFCKVAGRQTTLLTNSKGKYQCSDRNCSLTCIFNVNQAEATGRSQQRKRLLVVCLAVTALLAAVTLVASYFYQRQPGQLADVILIERLESANERTRLEAALELAERGNPAALAPLLVAMSSDSPAERTSIAKALGHLGDRRAVPDLSAMLDEENHFLAVAAAAALAEIGDESAVEPLLAALHNRPPKDRWALAAVFQTFQDERAVPDLLEAVVVDDINRQHTDDLLKAIAFQGADPIPSLVASVLSGGPGAWTLAEIEKTTGQKITPLHDAIANKDFEALSRAYAFFIYLDQDSSNVAENDRVSIEDQKVLAEALLTYGDKDMAQAFVNFRQNVKNPSKNYMAEAGASWAEEHGYILTVK